MNSLIFRTGARFILPLMLLFSVVVLLRGHNEPGGGFVGGLIAASSFALYAIASDVKSARRLLHIDLHVLIGLGLAAATLSGVLSMIAGAPFLDAQWTTIVLLDSVKVGGPLLFDIGVYLTVLGVTLMMIFTLAER